MNCQIDVDKSGSAIVLNDIRLPAPGVSTVGFIQLLQAFSFRNQKQGGLVDSRVRAACANTLTSLLTHACRFMQSRELVFVCTPEWTSSWPLPEATIDGPAWFALHIDAAAHLDLNKLRIDPTQPLPGKSFLNRLKLELWSCPCCHATSTGLISVMHLFEKHCDSVVCRSLLQQLSLFLGIAFLYLRTCPLSSASSASHMCI